MPAFVKPKESPKVATAPAAKPLDEAVWQAWVAKGRARDQRSSVARTKAMKWTSAAGLLAAAGLWSHLGPFEFVIRFLVSASAIVVMFQFLQARYYAVAAVFGALALFYNPVAPLFSFSGDWQRAMVATSAMAFVASLAWPNGRTARTEHNA